jgi:hypothetical protein
MDVCSSWYVWLNVQEWFGHLYNLVWIHQLRVRVGRPSQTEVLATFDLVDLLCYRTRSR